MRSFILLITAATVGACSTALEPGAERVRQINPNMTDTCQFLGPVTGGESMGIDVAADVNSAYNKVRNEVARRGGNAFVVSASSTSQAQTVVQADAYACK
ncbi:DUF4156 domain-containing protein [Roseovarius sp. MMSF_3359]|uniref:DUF4156 domain-containing protein n=1 Tax=unclassified Roseovarius TaxID=2614913 RepID=UPI003531E036